ncbi:MAG TPA: type II toxin-antitoxin system VapC family toxin [Burkholderiaceae bacterium]|nr:type II toxin-antitoxin system VapC family toxin [Burkholderiaceae bacterium]
MIGLDTNVLVRLLTADDAVQLRAATRLLSAHEGEAGAFFVNDMVLVEVVWVLGRAYGFGRDDILAAVKSLLHADGFAFEDRERLDRALALCASQACDFADTMIVLKNAAAPCEYTASFDRAMRALPGVKLL